MAKQEGDITKNGNLTFYNCPWDFRRHLGLQFQVEFPPVDI